MLRNRSPNDGFFFDDSTLAVGAEEGEALEAARRGDDDDDATDVDATPFCLSWTKQLVAERLPNRTGLASSRFTSLIWMDGVSIFRCAVSDEEDVTGCVDRISNADSEMLLSRSVVSPIGFVIETSALLGGIWM